jgi:hypothetical protein
MSNTRRLRRLPFQRQLDLDAGLWCPLCASLAGHYPVEGHLGDVRVVTWSESFFPTGWLNKQETPEVGASEASVPTANPRARDHSGCSEQSA